MKKLLLIILLTFTTFANADDGDYIISSSSSYVWILDAEQGELKYCWKWSNGGIPMLSCSKWEDINYNED